MSRVVCPHLESPADEELVDDDLGAVDEVAELRLPEHQRLGRRRAVAVLEARAWRARESGLLCSSIGASAPGSALDRREPLAGDDVVQHEVPLAERAALGVLAGEPDRHALGQQRRERQRLGVRPVDSALGPERRAAPLELLAQLRMDREPLGPAAAAAR